MSSINEDKSDIRVLADKAQKRLSAVVVETAKRLSAVINNVITPSDSDAEENSLPDLEAPPVQSPAQQTNQNGDTGLSSPPDLEAPPVQSPPKQTNQNGDTDEPNSLPDLEAPPVQSPPQQTNHNDDQPSSAKNGSGKRIYYVIGGSFLLTVCGVTGLALDGRCFKNQLKGGGMSLEIANTLNNQPKQAEQPSPKKRSPETLSELETAMWVEQSSFGSTTRDEFLEYVKNEKQIATQCPAKLMEFVASCNANPACRSKVGKLDVDKDSCFNHTNVRGVSSWIAVNFHELDGSDHLDFITMLEDGDAEDLRFVFGNMILEFKRKSTCTRGGPFGGCGQSCGYSYHFRNVSCEYKGNRTKIFKYSGGVPVLVAEPRPIFAPKNDLPIFATQGINKQYEELKMYVRKAKGLFEAEEV